jgi:hypothetical protein
VVIKCSDCGCEGVHACMGKPLTQEDIPEGVKLLDINIDKLNIELITGVASVMGYTFGINSFKVNGNTDVRVYPTEYLHDSFIFNPLTDDEILYKLIVSKGIQRYSIQGKGWFYSDQDQNEPYSVSKYGESRAACLAILASD